MPVTVTGFEPGVSLFVSNYGYTYPGSSSSTTQFAVAPSIGSPGTYAAYVVDQPPAGMSTAFNLIVTGPPDFTIGSGGTSSVTVAAGTTATFTNAISVGALNNFSSAVELNCSVPATATHGSVSPSSLSSGAGTATVT